VLRLRLNLFFAQEITLSSCVLPNIKVQHPKTVRVWKGKKTTHIKQKVHRNEFVSNKN
jgi:hypothetical protein